MITIVDYGLGNLGSIISMFKRLGISSQVTSSPEVIEDATKILLPGVGMFGVAMQRINAVTGLRQALDKKALIDRIPVLGVCLGMQLLGRSSEEGGGTGLNWIPAKTCRLPTAHGLKVPHMGWDTAKVNNPSLLTSGIGKDSRYYFVHSYFVKVDDPSHSLMTTNYGVDFDSAIGVGNIYGVQFHPEKSHKFGMKILENFANL